MSDCFIVLSLGSLKEQLVLIIDILWDKRVGAMCARVLTGNFVKYSIIIFLLMAVGV